MVVAMSTARAVQVAIDEIVNMIAMRNSGVSAVGTVFVSTVVSIALMLWCACNRVGCTLRQFALVYVVAVHMMEVAIVNIVNVIFVFDGYMAAITAVLVVVAIVCFARHISAPNVN